MQQSAGLLIIQVAVSDRSPSGGTFEQAKPEPNEETIRHWGTGNRGLYRAPGKAGSAFSHETAARKMRPRTGNRTRSLVMRALDFTTDANLMAMHRRRIGGSMVRTVLQPLIVIWPRQEDRRQRSGRPPNWPAALEHLAPPPERLPALARHKRLNR